MNGRTAVSLAFVAGLALAGAGIEVYPVVKGEMQYNRKFEQVAEKRFGTSDLTASNAIILGREAFGNQNMSNKTLTERIAMLDAYSLKLSQPVTDDEIRHSSYEGR